MKKQEKTNVMRVLDQKKIPYNSHTYDSEGAISGMEVAAALNQDPNQVFKTLVTIGASKKNVSSLFNAETVIIGFTSGLLGVGITYLLCIPINLILHALTGINNLSAYLPIPTAVILVAISVLLTLFAGIIPSRSAAKKDPVVALRTE